MSGLEPLAALGLACNVLQLTEMGHQTITIIQNVYRNGSLDDALDHNAAVLKSISDEIKTCKRPTKCPRHEQQLLLAAEKCSTAAQDLTEEVRFLVGNARKGSLTSALKVVTKTSWRKRRLERLKENLDSTEKLMQTGLLTRIWSSTTRTELDLDEVKTDLRYFIEQLRMGNRATNELVSREAIEIRKHVSSMSTETMQSIGRVHQILDSLVLDAGSQVSQAKRDRLLQSFKFPGLNERRSQIGAAYEGTGRWVFAGDGDGDGNGVDGFDHSAAPDSSDTSIKARKAQAVRHSHQYDLASIRWDSFSNWLRSTDTFYWISGKPGSGKSTLVKSIVNHPKTKACLNVWQPGALVISHFFWRPGTPMQHNVKGLLCSILHQVLQSSPTALDSVLQSIAHSGMKDADTDWSVADLLAVHYQVASTYDRPICMFLDGLDEVYPGDEVVRLLSLIDELSRNKNTKICLSSRPEPLLQRRLSNYPRLRLQDLNRSDLESYAQDHIQFPGGNIGEHGRHELVHSLVEKAEGVFLWVVLATNSINKGSEYGDTLPLLRERVNRLPGDLTALYKDMWERIGKDEPLEYRQSAALFFKLLLAHRVQEPRFEVFGSFNLLSFVLASTSTANEIFRTGNEDIPYISEDEILQRCKEIERKVNIYCCGLIDLGADSPRYLKPFKATGWYGNKYDKLLPFTAGDIQFMHRTAYDFLLYTTEGKEILDFDKSSTLSLKFRIIKAYLASTQIFLSDHQSYAGFFIMILESMRDAHENTDDWVVADWWQLLHHFEVLCKRGKLFVWHPESASLCNNEQFLKLMANTCCNEHVLLAIRDGKLSKDTKSDILLNACNIPGDLFAYVGPRLRFINETVQTLLEDGADPNYKGLLLSPTTWHEGFAQLQTPIKICLKRILILRLFFDYEEYFRVLETLRICIDHGANLDEMVTIAFDLQSTGPIGGDELKWELQAELPLFMKEIMPWDHSPRGDDMLLASFPAHVILTLVLLRKFAPKDPPPTDETWIHELCSYLEYKCDAWRSNVHPSLIGRLCHHETSPEEYALFETTGDHQRQIPTELLYWLESYIRQGGPLDNSRKMKSPLSQYTRVPWSPKVIGQDAIYERFQELGLIARVDQSCESLTMDDWMRRLGSKHSAGLVEQSSYDD